MQVYIIQFNTYICLKATGFLFKGTLSSGGAATALLVWAVLSHSSGPLHFVMELRWLPCVTGKREGQCG